MPGTIFVKKRFSIFILFLAAYEVLRNGFLSFVMGDLYGVISIALACSTLFFLKLKSRMLIVSLMAWSAYFISKNSINIVTYILTHHYQGYEEANLYYFLKKTIFLLIGLALILGSKYFILPISAKTPQSHPKV